MATIDLGNGAALAAADRIRPLRPLWRGPRFITEVFDGADDALAALEAVQGGLVATGFQSLDWLTVLYEELAPARHAMPRVVAVTDRNNGEVALILPLLIEKERKLTVARFADLGVSDYGGPVLGPALLKKTRSIRRAWRGILHAMPDVDLIRFERMPARIGGRPNPLLTRSGVTPARHSGNVLVIPETVEAFLRARDKKYRKEIERCYRLWEKQSTPRFYRAATPEELARVCSVLEEQQAARHGALNSGYVLNEPGYRAFYERLAIDGSDVGLASLFALEADGEIIATLFGVVHDGTFTLLRIGTAGEAWGHLSPGRLVIVEAMKHFVAQGIRRFDFGPGDDPFKRGFAVEEVPLHDLIVARDLSVVPRAVYDRLKGRLRKNPHARSVFKLLKPHSAR
jgi:CelD/BcsL family acetyltransferase involved in cellulose biosynthesis